MPFPSGPWYYWRVLVIGAYVLTPLISLSSQPSRYSGNPIASSQSPTFPRYFASLRQFDQHSQYVTAFVWK